VREREINSGRILLFEPQNLLNTSQLHADTLTSKPLGPWQRLYTHTHTHVHVQCTCTHVLYTHTCSTHARTQAVDNSIVWRPQKKRWSAWSGTILLWLCIDI